MAFEKNFSDNCCLFRRLTYPQFALGYRRLPCAACAAIRNVPGYLPQSLNVPNPCTSLRQERRDRQLPLRQSEEILPGDLALFCAIAEVFPLLSREAFPLDFRHSTAENQSPKLVNHPILLAGIVIREVCFQFREKLPLPALLLFEPEAHERSDRLAHARIGRSSVAGNVVGNARGQRHSVSRLGKALRLACCRRFTTSLGGIGNGVRHTASLCLTEHRV